MNVVNTVGCVGSESFSVGTLTNWLAIVSWVLAEHIISCVREKRLYHLLHNKQNSPNNEFSIFNRVFYKAWSQRFQHPISDPVWFVCFRLSPKIDTNISHHHFQARILEWVIISFFIISLDFFNITEDCSNSVVTQGKRQTLISDF